QLFTNVGELIGKRDVHITESVLHKLRQLSRPRVGQMQLAFDEGGIELGRLNRTARRNSPNDSIVVDELPQHASGKDALRAMGDVDIGGFPQRIGENEVWPHLSNPRADLLSCAYR